MKPTHSNSLIVLNSVDSTNNYAMARVYEGMARHGDGFFALEQTSGKGQRGKNWLSEKGQNIMLSVVLEPRGLALSAQFRLSVAVALAGYDFFSRYAGDETAVKWPNDIYWRDRKAGGILIENVIGSGGSGNDNAWKFAVAGIGININQAVFDEGMIRAVSLKQITGKQFDVTVLAAELQKEILQKVEELQQNNFPQMLERYNACLFKKDCVVKLRKGNVDFFTTIRHVMPDGRLFTSDTIDNYFEFGELEWVL